MGHRSSVLRQISVSLKIMVMLTCFVLFALILPKQSIGAEHVKSNRDARRTTTEKKNMKKEKRNLAKVTDTLPSKTEAGVRPRWLSYGVDQTWSNYANQAIKAAEDASVKAQQSADSARKHVEKATKEVQSWKEIKTLLDRFANGAAKTVNELTAKLHEESSDEMITEPVKKELSKEEFINVMLNDIFAVHHRSDVEKEAEREKC